MGKPGAVFVTSIGTGLLVKITSLAPPPLGVKCIVNKVEPSGTVSPTNSNHVYPILPFAKSFSPKSTLLVNMPSSLET